MRNVQYEQEENIGYIIFDRPKVGNALNHEMAYELSTWMVDAIQNEEILGLTALIITGNGKNFMYGADVSDFKLSSKRFDEFTASSRFFMRALSNLPPTIAAVDGYALGPGLELALACDYIIASESAMMGLPEITFGLIPGAGGTQLLPQKIGYEKAAEMILTGQAINAEQALQYGLVNLIVPQEHLLYSSRSFSVQMGNMKKRRETRLLENNANFYKDLITKMAQLLLNKLNDKPKYAVAAAIECLKSSLKDGSEIEVYDSNRRISLQGSIQEPNFEIEHRYFADLIIKKETQRRISQFLKCKG